ncbi:hypothetical protein O181_090678 [Austropuccinia psidii MF-1]|uniref:Uncharacterized protein n=1 Tax=Austropuccinia psidii MF-1 TaxID=1389203 RepID=A0A9Q3IVW2_9BASI|nr:hypothetical protein [Austropuccinia psidii MF-1]
MKQPSLISLKSSQSTLFQASESVVLICSSTLTPRPQHGEENVNPPTAIPCIYASPSVQTQASLIVPQATPKAELLPAASVHSRRKLVKRAPKMTATCHQRQRQPSPRLSQFQTLNLNQPRGH